VPFDVALAERIRRHVRGDLRISERHMFGGLCFTVNGNMCFGVIGDDLVVRVGPDGYVGALECRGVREMDFNGRPMRGWVYVAPEGVSSERSLGDWLDRGLDFAESLPAK
jgi:hypothetical protein